MNKIRILLYEDLDNDARLIKRVLEKSDIDFSMELATNQRDFELLLRSFMPNLVVSDYNVPEFNGLEALSLTKQQYDNLPFIFVTSTLNNEELAAETILKGANGYVLKKNLQRLPEIIKGIDFENKEPVKLRTDGPAQIIAKNKELIKRLRQRLKDLEEKIEENSTQDILNNLDDTLKD
ncbi:MAG: response regulator [Bacteroidota bacterium]